MSVDREQGITSLQQGDITNAIAALERAIHADPSDFQSATYLGAAYAQAERPADAVTILTQAVQIQPSNPQARFNLGVALQKSGWADQAVVAYEQALTLQSNYPQAQQALDALRPQTPPAPTAPPTQSFAPQPSYTPPQQGYAPQQQPYAPPKAIENPYTAPQSPYAYPTMDIDREKNRKGLQFYAYGGWTILALIAFVIISPFIFGIGQTFIAVINITNKLFTLAGLAMLAGAFLVYKATKVKAIGFVALTLAIQYSLMILGWFMPQPEVTPRTQTLTPEDLGALAAAGILGIALLCMAFASLVLALVGFRQIASGLNNPLAESQATSGINWFKISMGLFVGGFLFMLMSRVFTPFALLGVLVMFSSMIGLLLCWIRSLVVATNLASS